MKSSRSTEYIVSSAHLQGVVSYVCHVEAGSKLNQAIKAVLGSWLSNQGDLRAIKIIKSGLHGCNLTFEPTKIKRSKASQGTIKRSSTLFLNTEKIALGGEGTNFRGSQIKVARILVKQLLFKSAVFVNHCLRNIILYSVTRREGLAAASTAKLLYKHIV